MTRQLVLVCGVLSSATYLAADLLGALGWSGYSYRDQTISELAAIGSPSRAVTLTLFTAYNLLLGLMSIGLIVTPRRRLRAAGWCLAGIAALGIVAAFAPIHVRGYPWGVNETVHSILTAITVLLIVVAMVVAAGAFGGTFETYSRITLVTTIASGAASGWIGRGLASDLPTPWIGITERVSVFSFLLWVVVLATLVSRSSGDQPVMPRRRKGTLAA